jgi:hypothetical protein
MQLQLHIRTCVWQFRLRPLLSFADSSTRLAPCCSAIALLAWAWLCPRIHAVCLPDCCCLLCCSVIVLLHAYHLGFTAHCAHARCLPACLIAAACCAAV